MKVVGLVGGAGRPFAGVSGCAGSGVGVAASGVGVAAAGVGVAVGVVSLPPQAARANNVATSDSNSTNVKILFIFYSPLKFIFGARTISLCERPDCLSKCPK